MGLFSKKKKRSDKPKVGVVLSGGAARGFAHVGVLEALNEHGIYPDYISGVSAGAIAGVLYCDGYQTNEMLEIIKDRSLFKYVSISLPRNGLLSMNNMQRVLDDALKAKRFEDLKTPFYCNATNLNKGTAEYFHEGELLQRIMASASIPMLFKPVIMDDTTYVDGGVVDNFPVKPLQDKVDKIIGVHVNPTGEEKEIKGLIKIAERSFHISVNSHIDLMAESCDLFIQPEKLKQFGLLSVSDGKKIYEVGYEKTMEVLKKTNTKKFQ